MTDDELAQFWDKGNFDSSLDSLNYHYKEHVLKLNMGNDISKARFTYDALSFAERNASALKFVVPNNPALQPHFTLVQTKGIVLTGMNGQFTSSGKILTFWYNPL